jgi:hypothetical protein
VTLIQTADKMETIAKRYGQDERRASSNNGSIVLNESARMETFPGTGGLA